MNVPIVSTIPEIQALREERSSLNFLKNLSISNRFTYISLIFVAQNDKRINYK